MASTELHRAPSTLTFIRGSKMTFHVFLTLFLIYLVLTPSDYLYTSYFQRNSSYLFYFPSFKEWLNKSTVQCKFRRFSLLIRCFCQVDCKQWSATSQLWFAASFYTEGNIRLFIPHHVHQFIVNCVRLPFYCLAGLMQGRFWELFGRKQLPAVGDVIALTAMRTSQRNKAVGRTTKQYLKNGYKALSWGELGLNVFIHVFIVLSATHDLHCIVCKRNDSSWSERNTAVTSVQSLAGIPLGAYEMRPRDRLGIKECERSMFVRVPILVPAKLML